MSGRSGPGTSRERGSGTVLGIGLVALALTLTVVVATLGQVVAGRGAAQAAADLAALAAAERLQAPGGGACTVAASVATAHGTTLVGCAVAGEDVTVTVARDVGPGLVARAVARAGPVRRNGRSRGFSFA